jgi:glycosyltransferase involved in cell wall biosynthesis
MPFIIVIIPAYNEEKTISQVIQEVKPYVDQIVVVDDGSTDQTNKLATQERVVVLKHLINRGQGAALRTGMEYIKIKNKKSKIKNQESKIKNNDIRLIVVHIDSDAQHQAKDIPKMIQPILNGQAEVTLGSRFLDKNSQIPLSRRILLKGSILVNWFFTGIKLTDAHNGLRALSWRAANLIKINQDRMAHNSEIIQQIAKHDLTFQEIPVTVSYSKHSRSKGQTWWDGFRIVRDLIVSRIC